MNGRSLRYTLQTRNGSDCSIPLSFSLLISFKRITVAKGSSDAEAKMKTLTFAKGSSVKGKTQFQSNGGIDLESSCNILGLLIKSSRKGESSELTPDHIDAIERLQSSIMSRSNTLEGPSIMGGQSDASFNSSASAHYNKPRTLSLSKRVDKSMRIMKSDLDESEKDEDLSNAYRDVFDQFGGSMVCNNDNIVEIFSGHSKKTITLRGKARVSGNRLALMISSLQDTGGRIEHLSEISEFSDYDDDDDDDDDSQYYPPEWQTLNTDAKAKLTKLLSWESISRWDFNIVEVAQLTRNPLLLVGWVILCDDPLAQTEREESTEEENKSFRYNFFYMNLNHLKICNFLREIESRYNHDVPYHNNIHAADVTQTLHCMFQMMGKDVLNRIYDPLTVFSALLAATFHDVGHPGTNNTFQENALTPLAIQYNDTSVLESMHSAVGNSLLFGESKRDEWDIMKDWVHSDKLQARKTMMSVVLSTDMYHHFTHMEELDTLVEEVQVLANEEGGDEGTDQSILSILAQNLNLDEDELGEDSSPTKLEEECKKLAEMLLNFLLHASDISNPAKPQATSVYWANRALSEFFAQGDEEIKMKLPVSPLCDRTTVKTPESQIGFGKFVIAPAFELLGDIIPQVQEEVLPIIDNNIEYWMSEKLR